MTTIVDRVVEWAGAEFGGPVSLAGPARSEESGFDSEIHFVELAGRCLPADWARSLVVRVKSQPEEAELAHHEAAVQNWASSAGLPVPRVLTVLDPGVVDERPVQIMERAAGAMALDLARRAPWRARATLRTLARLHVDIHRADPTDFPTGADLLDRRLSLVRHVVAEQRDADLADGLARVEAIADGLRAGPQVPCHGDFHPLNVLIGPTGASVIDWTDAGLGDPHGDLARTLVLFESAAVVASSAIERVALARIGPRLASQYRRAYAEHALVDDRRIQCWAPVHLLHAWCQARTGSGPGLGVADALGASFSQAMAVVDRGGTGTV